jgi:hypothetical protein
MKVVKEIVFGAMVACALALGVAAQADQDKEKKPPKNPPVVNPGNKPPPTPKQKP